MFIIFPAASFALLFCLASSQNFITSTLPVCAQQCTFLQQAQTGCVPPAAPVTNQGIYQSCFCLSDLLKQLPVTPSVTCPNCPPADLVILQNWFAGLCTQQPTTLSTSSTSLASTASVPTATPSSAAGQNPAGGSTISDQPPPDNRRWIQSHWRWVLMLIILFFGFGILAWAGWYLHRRYHRLHDGDAMMTSATSARRQPDLVTWGPGQSVHDFGAVGEVAMPQMHEKGKGSARPDAALQQQQQQHHQQHQHQHQHQPPQPPQPPPQQNPEKEKGSRRLKKVLLAGRG